MSAEKVVRELEEEFKDILRSHGAMICTGAMRENGEGTFSVTLNIDGGLDGLGADFNIKFDGTNKDFAAKAVEALYDFDAGECARENIEDYDISDAEDMHWYIDRAEALHYQCENLAEELEEYEADNTRTGA